MPAYRFVDDALIEQVLRQASDDFQLLFSRQPLNRRFNDSTDVRLMSCNEAVVVHVCKETHDELTVHSVSHSAMTRNRLAKILDFESSFETRSKEATKGSDERGERGENQDMELHGCNHESLFDVGPMWEVVLDRGEDWVGSAVQSRENAGSKVIDGADEV